MAQGWGDQVEDLQQDLLRAQVRSDVGLLQMRLCPPDGMAPFQAHKLRRDQLLLQNLRRRCPEHRFKSYACLGVTHVHIHTCRCSNPCLKSSQFAWHMATVSRCSRSVSLVNISDICLPPPGSAHICRGSATCGACGASLPSLRCDSLLITSSISAGEQSSGSCGS